MISFPELVDDTERELSFRGTCFALWHTNTLITAAHCVEGVTPGQLRVEFPHAQELYRVAEVTKHPEADIAVLHLDEQTWPQNVEAFQKIDYQSSRGPGANFLAFGFPEAIFAQDAREPTARLFKGHFQRLFDLTSHAGYRFRAGELSIPVPIGLSGGPLFLPIDHTLVSAVAAENHESYTLVEGFEEERSRGHGLRVEHRRVVQYGIAVMLADVTDWLEAVIKPGPRYPRLGKSPTKNVTD